MEVSRPPARRVVRVFSHCTGLVSCFARVARMESASAWGSVHVGDDGNLGGLDGRVLQAGGGASAAGAMKSVWNAPATASLTTMRALNSGLAISATLSMAATDPETA